MRINLWRAIIAGSIIGAAFSMMHRRGHISRLMADRGVRGARDRAHRVLRGVTKSVNNLIK